MAERKKKIESIDSDFRREMQEHLTASIESDYEEREESKEDLRFANGDQWDKDILSARAGRPSLVKNQMPQFINHVANEFLQSRPSIKVRPADEGASAKQADVLSDLIRHIEYVSNAASAYDTGGISIVSGGIGSWRIITRYDEGDTFDQVCGVKRIVNPYSVHPDPYCSEADGSDMEFCFVDDVISKDAYERDYPNAARVSGFSGIMGSDVGDWLGNDSVILREYWTRTAKPRKILLMSDDSVIDNADFSKYRDFYTQHGITVVRDRMATDFKVKQYITNGVEILDETEWLGRSIPIVIVYGQERWIDGKRKFNGVIRWAKDPQRTYNYWNSAITELFALQPKAPWIGTEKNFEGHEAEWRTANVKNHSRLTYKPDALNPGGPRREPPPQISSSLVGMLEVSAQEMRSTTGIYQAGLGAQGNESSGVAIGRRQAQSDRATYSFQDAMIMGIRATGKILVDLIPHIYTGDRVVQTLNSEGKSASVSLRDSGVDLAKGRYDVMIDTGPSYATKRIESVQTMLEFIRIFPSSAPLLADMVAKNSDWPNADKVSERLMTLLPPALSGKPMPPDAGMMKLQLDASNAMANQEMEQEKLDIEKLRVMADVVKTIHGLGMDEHEAKHDLLMSLHKVMNGTGMPKPGNGQMPTQNTGMEPPNPASAGLSVPQTGGNPVQPPSTEVKNGYGN